MNFFIHVLMKRNLKPILGRPYTPGIVLPTVTSWVEGLSYTVG